MAEVKEVAEVAEVKPFVPNPKDTFKVGEKKYYMLVHAVNIPEMGIRTAADILVDTDAQKALVEIGCLGTIISEVVGK